MGMWDNFFEAGGFGMYPTMLFGFLFIAAAAFHALRRDARHLRVAFALGVATFASALLGTSVGICTSVHYVKKVPPPEQFMTMWQGIEESLHNAVLGLIIIVIGALISAAGVMRRPA